ncbi:MAG: phage portal protein [Firmicutes bacterium]|jgi:SPP1 family phage portal protein|nr:phage portal protein [Bacillota bacterium]
MDDIFRMDRNTRITGPLVSKIIDNFLSLHRPRLQRYLNYYDGKQDILNKRYADETKPCNKIVTNYCFNIVQNYAGYLTGIPISYKSQQDIDSVQDVLNYNDVHNEDDEFLKNALIHGVAYEVCYCDEEGRQRFKLFDSRECVPVHTNDLAEDLLFLIHFYADNDVYDNVKHYVDVYTGEHVIHYTSDLKFDCMKEIGRDRHYYKQVPVSVFWLNDDKVSVFDKIMGLQDAYNTLLSAETDDFEAFADAYLVLEGMDGTRPEDIEQMKKNRVLLVGENGKACYLTKSINDTQIQNMLQNLNDTIHKIANSPDFNDEKLMAQSGIAMRYKLTGMEANASNIVSNMTKALRKRIELIATVENIKGELAVWRDIEIVFTRNLPVNELEQSQLINNLRGLVSDKTLLSQLSFIPDVDAELEQVKKETEEKQERQQAYMDAFGGDEDETGQEDEETTEEK